LAFKIQKKLQTLRYDLNRQSKILVESYC
jgi:hypothetical protein